MAKLIFFGNIPDAATGHVGTVVQAQQPQTEAVAGKLAFAGAVAQAQPAQTDEADGALAFAGAVVQAQQPQTGAASALLNFPAAVSQSQPAQAESVASRQTFAATVAQDQAPQTEDVDAYNGQLSLGVVAQAQAAQSEAVAGEVAAVAATRPSSADIYGRGMAWQIVQPWPVTGAVDQKQGPHRERAAAITQQVVSGAVAEAHAVPAQAARASLAFVASVIQAAPLRAPQFARSLVRTPEDDLIDALAALGEVA